MINENFSQSGVTTVLIPASEDSYICEDPNLINENFKKDSKLIISMWSFDTAYYRSRALIKFDLSTMPSNINIVNAVIKLRYIGDGKFNDPRNAYLYRIIEPWSADSVTWANQPNYTLNERIGLLNFQTLNGDYTIDVPDLVTGWIDSSFTNYGIIISIDSTSSVSNIELASNKIEEIPIRPVLEITYYYIPVERTYKSSAISSNPLYKTSSDSTTYYPQESSIRALSWTAGGSLTIQRSLIKFDLSLIPVDAEITDAKLNLNGANHFYNSQSNACVLQNVAEEWDERDVTWVTQPTVDNSNQALLPCSRTPNENYSVDIFDFVTNWHSLDSENYGLLLKLREENYYRSMNFYSSSTDNTYTNFPNVIIQYRVANPTYGFSIPEKILDGKIYNAYGRTVYLHWREEYEIGKLTFLCYKLIDETGTVVADCNNSGNSVITSSPKKVIRYGDNYLELNFSFLDMGTFTSKYYIMEIENSKGEKYYLRFKVCIDNGE